MAGLRFLWDIQEREIGSEADLLFLPEQLSYPPCLSTPSAKWGSHQHLPPEAVVSELTSVCVRPTNIQERIGHVDPDPGDGEFGSRSA